MVGSLAGSICQHYENRAKSKIPAMRILTEYWHIRPAVIDSVKNDLELAQVAINETLDILRADVLKEDGISDYRLENAALFLEDVPNDLFMAMITQLNAGEESDVKLSVVLGKQPTIMKRYSSIMGGGE